MRIGQTSLIVFVSQIFGSIAGFVATLYFARELGAGILGIYSLVLAVVAWAAVAGKIGITSAVGKRMSEGDDEGAFFTAGLSALFVMFLFLSLVLYVLRGPVEAYIGRPVIGLVILLLFATLLNTLSGSTLTGSHLVHVQGLLTPVRMAVRSVTQIGLVFLGFELTGMLAGHALGYALIGAVGILIATPPIRLPSRRHFVSLFSYAKYAWLGSVERRTFGWVDVAIMGLFVPPNLIGIYSVAWTISTFLLASGSAISSAIFPEISNLTVGADSQDAAPILRDALRYAGVILIPGLVGAAAIGPRILHIYGQEFTAGATVLTLLVAAVLLRSYQKQLIATLGGIDRPDLTFNVNVTFVGSNIVLNLVLVYLYGWIGAAVATVLSAGIGTVLAYRYVASLIDFEIPFAVIRKQIVAAGACGVVAYGGRWIEDTYGVIQHNFMLVLLLASLGAAVYFGVLYVISAEFRTTVLNNLPDDFVSALR